MLALLDPQPKSDPLPGAYLRHTVFPEVKPEYRPGLVAASFILWIFNTAAIKICSS